MHKIQDNKNVPAVQSAGQDHRAARYSSSLSAQHFTVIEEVKQDEGTFSVEPFVANESGNIVYEDSPEEIDRKVAGMAP